jgi:hypothetical protein
MSAPSVHDDWLSLIEISGPFLAVPVLKEVFPQGLEELDATKRKRLRQAYEEWREALELEDAQFAELHVAWIDEVLSRGLALDEDGKGDVLMRADWCAANLQATLPEHGVTLSPDLAVVDEQRVNKPLMLIQTYAQDVDLDATLKLDVWAATPADRMVQLCRSLGCRLGLVTNGERWMLVDAPVGAVTTFASWYARIWSHEPITLQAFVHLLGIRRFFVDETEQLPALFDRSLKFQDEVTDALGEQVRRAVEVLIQTLDKADQDRNRELLHDVKEPELYEAALTVMMRLVFLLSAEERGLLLMGDARYETNYALSTLRMQLRKESEEILERRWDAWSRLLAIFRVVFGGIEHENLRLPALGGSLFDPDRFPFLEGRVKGSNWRSDPAKPLPIDNRTVLLLLEAIQQFQGRTLSYRALDVEQIGYVYEGLLERTVKRTAEVTLELDATKSAQSPWVTLAELESARLDGAERLAELLQQRSGSSASRVRNDLARPVDDALADRLLTACHGDTALRDRIKPFGHLVRTDPWGYPLVYPARAFIVTIGSDRRETGTHYTPKSLTEAIVVETLTPIAYVGPAQGTPRADWALKSPAELLDLKICDPAMGSGAFLVQACRWLADRLVEAWAQAEAQGKTVSVDGWVVDAYASREPLPRDTDARTIIARRLIAERCLYGVDLNPLAVELAKLSIWLVTLAKGRPFGFLDHNLRCGDSLLGIHRLDQLTQLSMNPSGQGQLRLFGQNVEQAVRDAIELRLRLREMPTRDIRDVEAMAHLDADARRKLEVPECIADAFIGEVFASGGNCAGLENALASLTIQAGQVIDGDQGLLTSMRRRSIDAFSSDLPGDKPVRRPFHWPLNFPEVFDRDTIGFDAIVGNPPFLGGKKISGSIGEPMLRYLKTTTSETGATTDLCAYFFRRGAQISGSHAAVGLIATNTISEGDTRSASLDYLCKSFKVIFAIKSLPWPGVANLSVAIVVFCKFEWNASAVLDGQQVSAISPFLTKDEFGISKPHPINVDGRQAYMGTIVLGEGFVITPSQARDLIENSPKNAEVIFPYMNGDDLANRFDQSPSRAVINFGDRSLDEAKTYVEPYRIVEELVRPQREKVKRDAYRNKWWQFAEKCKNLYSSIGGSSEVLVCGNVSKYLNFAFVPVGPIFTANVFVFNVKSYGDFACLQSALHESFARAFSSTLETRLSYSPRDVFYTFPFPSDTSSLDDFGVRYHELRSRLLRERKVGLTKLFNDFHNSLERDSVLKTLRDLTEALNYAVLASYGWQDMDLQMGFHEVTYLQGNDRTRYTISDTARIEVLRRLLDMNQRRYADEIKQGLHARTTAGSRASKPGVQRRINSSVLQPSFDFEPKPAVTVNNATPYSAILGFLEARGGWHAKADVIAATGVTDGQWNAAIADLISQGRVERQGEKRGARYRIQPGHRGDDHEWTS